MSTSKTIQSALISVFSKEGLEPIVKLLHSQNVTLYSTGGTEEFIKNLGIPVVAVEDITAFPEILGGRVKTLHPKIFGGILNRQDNESDVLQMQEFNIPQIDLVIVDLYPFEKTVASGASEQDIKKRKIALDNFLEKIKTDRPKAKPRKRAKFKTPIFATGDCLVFKLTSGNYGGAVVLATDNNPETAYNLVATSRINQNSYPTLKDFENAEVLIRNFGEWQDKVDVTWYMPDLFKKEYDGIFENIGKIPIELEYDIKNHDGKGYLFQPSWTAGWNINDIAGRQFESELTKPKSTKTLTIKQLTKKEKWWKVF